MDSILDVLSVHREHKEAAQMVKWRLCLCIWDERGRERERRERKGPRATPAFILGCMASCYSNMTWHSFSPAVFDQFLLLPLPRQPSFVLKCLATAADFPPVFQRGPRLTRKLLSIRGVSVCGNTTLTVLMIHQ